MLVNIYFHLFSSFRKILQFYDNWVKSQIVKDMSDVGLSCDLGRGVMETLSVSAVSTARGHRRAEHGGTYLGHGSARAKGQKFGARPTDRNPMGRKRSVSPTARPAQNGGITQTLHLSGTPRYYTHRYKRRGLLLTYRLITTVYKSGALYLYLPHGYRNIITCTGRDLAWDRVL